MVNLSFLSNASLISGSFGNTSNPADPSCPLSSASSMACSSTTPPRAVLTRHAPRFILSNCALPKNLFVLAFKGTCNETTSACSSSSSNEEQYLTAFGGCQAEDLISLWVLLSDPVGASAVWSILPERLTKSSINFGSTCLRLWYTIFMSKASARLAKARPL